MKVYKIEDEIRELQGKNKITYYEYKCQRDEQVWKRLKRYIEQGYDVEWFNNWWTTTEIKLAKKEVEQ